MSKRVSGERARGGDIHARRTPYELVFTEGEFETRLFPRIETEGREHQADTADPVRFGFLSTAAEAIREITPEDAPPDALDQYRAILFHAFNFWAGERRLFVLDKATSRLLVESPAMFQGVAVTELSPGADAGYVQFPPNLFWSSISPNLPPEPVDGFFYTVERAAVSGGELHAMLVLGLRRDRAGFSVIEVVAGDSEEEMDVPRAGGDFSNTLPGGDIEGLYSILTTREARELVRRSLASISAAAIENLEEVAAEPDPPLDQPPTTRLSYTVVRVAPRGESAALE